MRTPRNLASALRAYVQGRDRVWKHERKLGPRESAPAEPEFGSIPPQPSFGVPVADQLDFSRGPAAWRDRDRQPGS